MDFHPRVGAMPLVAAAPNERWANDFSWALPTPVMDCHSGELLGRQLPRSGTSKTAEAALEQALIALTERWDACQRRSCFARATYYGLVFTSRSFAAVVRGNGLRQKFTTPRSPEQNGMVERLIRTLKEQSAHLHRFETFQHASRVIGDLTKR